MLINKSTRQRSYQQNKTPSHPEEMHKVFHMIDTQESQIMKLLNKYGEQPLHHQYMVSRGKKTIDQSQVSNSRATQRSNVIKTSRERKYQRLQPYIINPNNPKTEKIISRLAKSNQKQDSRILPSVLERLSKSKQKKSKEKDLWSPREKKNIKDNLYNIYGKHNKYLPSNQQQSKVKPKKLKTKAKRKLTPITPAQSISVKREEIINEEELQEQYETNFQIEVDEDKVDSDDDSQDEDVPTTYYERQFRDTMKGQCTEELNFLFFSKNTIMKEWTQTLLSMLEKHDKEILGLRRKSKYLYNFDDSFFTFGIYENE